MNIKQKIIHTHNAGELVDEINNALSRGWLVHSITVNPETTTWIAVMNMDMS